MMKRKEGKQSLDRNFCKTKFEAMNCGYEKDKIRRVKWIIFVKKSALKKKLPMD